MMDQNKNVDSDSKGFIPVEGNEPEGRVDQDKNENASPPVQPSDPNPTLASPPVDGSVDVPETADANDEEDVPAALERETQDGPGFPDDDEDKLPDSDFAGYATDDVEETQ